MANDSDRNGPRRPALVDELERMGFRPADPVVDGGFVPVDPLRDGASAAGQPEASQPRQAQPAGSRVLEPEPAAVDPAAADPAGTGSQPAAPTPAATAPAAVEPARPTPPAPTPPAPNPSATNPPAPTPAHREAARPTSAQREPSRELTEDDVMRPRVEPPSGGWRRAVFVGSAGTINPGPSAAERRHRDLVARATRPVPGCWRVAVISLKGGVGKTTTTAGLGIQLATLRGDRVIAVDANPDRGTLAEKVPDPNPATVRDLLRNRDRIHRYSDVRAFTSLSPSRMEVLASDADPTASQAFSEDDYRDAIGVLEHFYSLVLTDCGTGLLHSAMSGVLAMADALVVVSSASLDGARSASATLDWLEAHGRAGLVEQAVAVVSSVRPRGGLVDIDAVQEHFARRCRAVVTIPFDPHLEAGATVTLERMSKRTRQAYLELAAAVGDGLP